MIKGRPISKFLLCDSVTYRKRIGVDEFQNVSFDTDTTIDNVKVEFKLLTTNTSNGEMNEDTLTLYYDFINSTPKDVEFNELDEIDFEGQTYVVRRKPIYVQHHVTVFCT